MLLNTLREIIEDQESMLSGKYLARTKTIPQSGLIIVISGIRRCGKSTLMKLFLKKDSKMAYINFEDLRLSSFGLDDFLKLETIFKENDSTVFCFDEIQNIPEWEKYVRSAHEKGINIIVTGSNSSLLSRELGTKLTGRYVQIELFPFSYEEFLRYKKLEAGPESLKIYLKQGGFPEYINHNFKEYLQTLLRDIVLRDIVVRRKIRNEKVILELALYILSNTGKLFSYNNVSNLLNIKSTRTTIDYCDYLQDAYLIHLVPKYSFSIKKQISNQKKAYCVDNGLINTNTLSFSKDSGRMLENIVFQQLRRNYNEIYYHKEKNECDFLVKEGREIIRTIQVCWEVNGDNMKREIDGIKEAMQYHKNADGEIITFNQEDEIDGISLIPAWKWLTLTSQ